MSSRPRRWFRYSLRTLLVLLTVLCMFLGWFVGLMKDAIAQREAVAALQSQWDDLIIQYDYQVDSTGNEYADPEPPGSEWLREFMGIDYFANITEIHVGLLGPNSAMFIRHFPPERPDFTDATLLEIKKLKRLRSLDLMGSAITDAGLEHVAALTRLEELDITGTAITETGIQKLQAALPRLQILRDTRLR